MVPKVAIDVDPRTKNAERLPKETLRYPCILFCLPRKDLANFVFSGRHTSITAAGITVTH